MYAILTVCLNAIIWASLSKFVWKRSLRTALFVLIPFLFGDPLSALFGQSVAYSLTFIGITGGIASGKSTYIKAIQQRGYCIIDADQIAREVIEPTTACYKRIVHSFGQSILKQSGEIDRDVLGSLIFSDSKARTQLNKITHPTIAMTMIKRIFLQRIRGNRVFVEVPLLFEGSSTLPGKLFLFLCSPIVVISVNQKQQLIRLKARNCLSHEDATRRIQAQMPLQDKVKMADIVLENSEGKDSIERNITVLLEML